MAPRLPSSSSVEDMISPRAYARFQPTNCVGAAPSGSGVRSRGNCPDERSLKKRVGRLWLCFYVYVFLWRGAGVSHRPALCGVGPV